MKRVLLALGLLSSGCAWTVRAQADLPGGWAQLPSGERVALPADLRLRYTPLHKPQRVTFGAPSARELTLNLREQAMPRWGLRLLTDPLFRPRQVYGDTPRETLRVLLVRDHGPAGTWRVEDQLSSAPTFLGEPLVPQVAKVYPDVPNIRVEP